MATRRPGLLAISIGLVLATVLGVMGFLHAIAPDREAIRAALAREIDRVEALPAGDPVPKDRRIEELLEVDDYRIHARALWLRLDRLHGSAHQAARVDVEARKAVAPFFARCANLEAIPAADLRTLDDEARSLQALYGATRFGPGLAEVRARLSARMAAAPGCGDMDHFRLLQEAQKGRLDGRYAWALTRIDEALPKHPTCDLFLAKLRGEREAVLKTAAQTAEKLLVQARKDRREGRAEDAARSLERAMPTFQGLPDAGRLKALLTELRRP